jgi:drug/metabolite transporter (DMT)-like permease
MQNAFLYAITSLIWGSTWIAITFQLGAVAPEASIVYRFALAALVLGVFVLVRKLPMAYSRREHAFIALQGAFLFSFNYILVYLAEQHLPSGLVAIVFSTLIIMNVLLGALLLRNPIRPRVLGGGFLGVAGLILVFSPEIAGLDFSGGRGLGLALSFVGVLSASIGNVIAARNQRSGLPVVQSNALGMAYGAMITLVVALVRGVDFTIDSSPAYLISLAYLVVFGSVIAFGAYLTLIGRMGIDRAAYIGVVFPLVALALSTVFEGLVWNLAALLGVVLVVAGNVLVLSRRRRVPAATPPSGQA